MQTHTPKQLASMAQCTSCGNPEKTHYIDPPDCGWCPPGRQGNGGSFSPFRCMLAKEGDLSKVQFPLVVQAKLDGIRASVVDGKLVSRTLKPIPNAEIREALEHPEFEGLDGELIVGPETAPDCYRRTSSFVMAPNKTGEPWAFMVFDKWNEGRADYYARYEAAQAIVERMTWTDVPVFMVNCRHAGSLAELEAIEAEMVGAGHEGAIARVPSASYKFGRSGKLGPLLKIKRFIDFEAEVIGLYEQMHNANEATRNELGRTQRSSAKAGMVPTGLLGGLVVRALNGPSEGITFEVGTGFKRDERIMLWQAHHGTGRSGRADLIIGRVAKVKSFPIGVKDRPRFPVFLGWRDLTVDG